MLFGRDRHSGSAVVVKVEGSPGQLATEHRALRWMAGHAVAVPGVRSYGVIRDGLHRGQVCLVLNRLSGTRPKGPAHWWRMGTALAALSQLPVEGCGISTTGPEEFVASHERLAAMLRAQLPGSSAEMVTNAARTARPPRTLPRPVFSHGDPGPGNFLVHKGGSDYLLDFETAQVAPAGLDPARAAFLALLAADMDDPDYGLRNATSVWHAYAERSTFDPTEEMTRWWLTLAGLQFIAFRWRRRDTERVLPWQDAVATLSRAEEAIQAITR